jgi:hypothetical protein
VIHFANTDYMNFPMLEGQLRITLENMHRCNLSESRIVYCLLQTIQALELENQR